MTKTVNFSKPAISTVKFIRFHHQQFSEFFQETEENHLFILLNHSLVELGINQRLWMLLFDALFEKI